MRCINRSCSDCTSMRACAGATLATTARGLRPPNEVKPSICRSNDPRLTRDSMEAISWAIASSTSPMKRNVQMIVPRIDPSRPRQPAAQGRERVADIGRNFDSGEKTRHCETLKSRGASGSRALNQFFDRRQDAHHNRIDAGDIRMKAVALVQLRIGGNAIQEERIKDDRVS